MWWIIGIIAWLACGVFTWGWSFAWFQGEYADYGIAQDGYKEDLTQSAIFSLAGPCFLVAFIFCMFVTFYNPKKMWYGWRLW